MENFDEAIHQRLIVFKELAGTVRKLNAHFKNPFNSPLGKENNIPMEIYIPTLIVNGNNAVQTLKEDIISKRYFAGILHLLVDNFQSFSSLISNANNKVDIRKT